MPTCTPRYTTKQGQYLAFIFYYTRIHARPPAEADMRQYFQTSPPTVHSMVLKLEEKGLIRRIPGQARSIELRVPREELPDLGMDRPSMTPCFACSEPVVGGWNFCPYCGHRAG